MLPGLFAVFHRAADEIRDPEVRGYISKCHRVVGRSCDRIESGPSRGHIECCQYEGPAARLGLLSSTVIGHLLLGTGRKACRWR